MALKVTVRLPADLLRLHELEEAGHFSSEALKLNPNMEARNKYERRKGQIQNGLWSWMGGMGSMGVMGSLERVPCRHRRLDC